jgi:methyl-accepting chemotaxis protein
MTEIPSWWLGVSGVFFVLGTVAMIACVIGLIKVLQMLNEISPQVKATAQRVEEVATRVEEVAETVKTTVTEMSGRARNIAGAAEGIVNRTANVVANQSPWIVGVMTAIRLFKAVQEMRGQRSHNGASTKALPKPAAKAKH